MTLMIEDSPRNNVAKWTSESPAVANVAGVVLSPFCTPLSANTYKQSLATTIQRIRDDGKQVYLDPVSHAFQMPGMGDLRYYDEYDLWGGAAGDISNPASRREHVRRVFELQDRFELPRVAPTALLHTPTSTTSTQALALARDAADLCDRDGKDCVQTIAGTGSFWSGASLDAHVGALAQLRASGWFVVYSHPTSSLPVTTGPAEVHGVCRTVRALADLCPLVHVSHGDFAGLPAVAAGAASVGTGWDTRQRVSAFASYVPRDPDGEGGGWFKRPTAELLCGVLPRQDAEVLQQQNTPLATQVFPGALHVDQPQVAFDHHTVGLERLIAQIQGAGSREKSFNRLLSIYEQATALWQSCRAHITPPSDEQSWITPLRDGLLAYGATEGWVP